MNWAGTAGEEPAAPLTKAGAKVVAQAVATTLGPRLKSVHVMPKLHEGVINIRCYLRPLRSEEVPEPVPYIFNVEELVQGELL